MRILQFWDLDGQINTVHSTREILSQIKSNKKIKVSRHASLSSFPGSLLPQIFCTGFAGSFWKDRQSQIRVRYDTIRTLLQCSYITIHKHNCIIVDGVHRSTTGFSLHTQGTTTRKEYNPKRSLVLTIYLRTCYDTVAFRHRFISIFSVLVSSLFF